MSTFRFASCYVFILLLWRYSPTWTYSILHLQVHLFSAAFLHFLPFNILTESLSTVSYQLPLGLPTGLLPSVYPFSAFLAILSPFTPHQMAHHLNSSQSYIPGWLHLLVKVKKFRDYTCFVTVCLQTRVHTFLFSRMFVSNALSASFLRSATMSTPRPLSKDRPYFI